MHKTLTVFFLLICATTNAQILSSDRYSTSIFGSQLTQDIQYASAPQWVWPYWDVDLRLDVYEPVGDLNMKRPLIIFAHAGGFVNGSKNVDNMQAICDTFARKGFVTATIDYRKGFDPLDTESAERAVYRAVQDGKAAVRFFKENATLYNIDTNYVFFGGMSAGGFVSYHVAYLDKEAERPASTYGGGTVNDLGCLDCAGNSFAHSSQVKAVLNYWGATIDTLFMEAGDVPIMLMHGTQDPTVPYDSGFPFGLPTLPTTYGSKPIKNTCEALGIPYEIYINDMDIHMMDSSNNGTWDPSPNAFWGDTLLPFTTNFIYKLITPNTVKLSPDTVTVSVNDIADFEVSNEQGVSIYQWDFDGINIAALGSADSEIESFQFTTAGTYDIYVNEYNAILAEGDTLRFTVVVEESSASTMDDEWITDMYPNPATDKLVFKSKGELPFQLYFVNALGQLIETIEINQEEQAVDVAHLPRGFYNVQFIVSEHWSSAKLILE